MLGALVNGGPRSPFIPRLGGLRATAPEDRFHATEVALRQAKVPGQMSPCQPAWETNAPNIDCSESCRHGCCFRLVGCAAA